MTRIGRSIYSNARIKKKKTIIISSFPVAELNNATLSTRILQKLIIIIYVVIIRLEHCDKNNIYYFAGQEVDSYTSISSAL